MIPKGLSRMFIVVVLLVIVEVYSTSNYTENRFAPLVRNTYSNICPKPELQNGIIRIKLRGKFLRFDCDKDFSLVGAKYVLCKNGRWNSPPPICVKPGCSDLPPVANGFIFYENAKAAATLFCDAGYKIFGPMYSYCNGTDWDRTIGSCRSSGLTIEKSCNFETEDFCGWENAAVGSVEWERSSGVVSRRLLKTGPKHDHTTGQPLNGHFMMVDSSQQDANATAHLISPIYSRNYSTKACFRFFYHMFGDVGTLAVYVKPVSLELGDILKQTAQFTVTGNQGNTWKEGYFDLQKQNESFQIVIQASLGMRYKSDTAIDDVALLNGNDCQSNGTVVVPITESDLDIFRIDSCVNRCGHMHASSVDEDGSNVIHCGCTSDCGADNNLCCPDYAEACLFNDASGTEEDMVTLAVSRPTVSFDDMNYHSILAMQPFEKRSDTVANLNEPGCSDLPPVANGFFIYDDVKVAAKLFCSLGYKVFGPDYSYCNGTDWDRTIGSCRSSALAALAVQLSCNFETDDLCGWENAAVGGVEWRRSFGIVSRQLLKTGSKHYHTTGGPLSGHFMMVDCSQQYTNATAQLISPIYSRNYSAKACFRFFYHMYGDVGMLSVYVKPVSLELGEILKQAAQFTVAGNQGNAWKEGYFALQKQKESFQIVVQASLGMCYNSDMAIDDVALFSGNDCKSTGTVVVPITESDLDVFRIDSCVNRCGYIHTSSVDEDGSSLIPCECTSDCGADNNLCCPDYAEVCLFGKANGTEAEKISDTNLNGKVSGTTVALGVLGALGLITGLVLVMVYYRADCGVDFISWLKSRNTAGSDGHTNASDEVRYLTVNNEVSGLPEE